MPQGRFQSERIIALTAAIERAREALRLDPCPGAHEALTAAEAAYKTYLTSLNGLEEEQRRPVRSL